MAVPGIATFGDLADPQKLLLYYFAVTKSPGSLETRSLEIDAMRRLVLRYLQEYPEIAATPVEITQGEHTSYYSWAENKLVLGVFSPAVVAHELEHLLKLQAPSVYRTTQHLARAGRVLATMAALGIPVAHFISKKPLPIELLRGAQALSIASSLPVLYEEGRASLEARKKFEGQERNNATLALLRGFTTYVDDGVLTAGVHEDILRRRFPLISPEV